MAENSGVETTSNLSVHKHASGAVGQAVAAGQKIHRQTGNLVVELKAATATTPGNTATTVLSFPVPLSSCVAVEALIVGKKAGANADGLVAKIFNACTNAAGTTALVGTTGGSVIENSAGAPTADIVADDTNDLILVQVTGVTAETWDWSVEAKVLKAI